MRRSSEPLASLSAMNVLPPKSPARGLRKRKRSGLKNRSREGLSPCARGLVELADRVDASCMRSLRLWLACPGQGHRREDLTQRPVLFLYALFVRDRLSARY